MPLGASITYGFFSSDGNGYRNVLQSLLELGGNTDISFVGTQPNGTMFENATEGFPGLRIDQVYAKAATSVPQFLPNVILVNLGTNDCVYDFNLNSTTEQSTVVPKLTANSSYTIGDRMRILVEDLMEWSPGATVVLSTLINNLKETTDEGVIFSNVLFREVAADLAGQGKRVVLSEMTADAGGPNTTTMSDVTHPNDIGYSMMANRWYEALTEAGQKNLIVEPQ